MTSSISSSALIARSRQTALRLTIFISVAAAGLAQPAAQATSRSAGSVAEVPRQHITKPKKDLIKMSENKTPPGAAEMAAAKAITVKVLAIGT
jgi:hypothetical protein